MTLPTRMLDAVSEFRDDPDFKILEGPSNWVLRLAFNHTHPLLSRREIREAFAHALDLEDIAQRLRHGQVEVGNPGILPPQSPWQNPDIPPYIFDLNRAKSLVKAAGVAAEIVELLKKLGQAEHVTILFISHDLAQATRLCDRIGVMHAGKLVEVGAPGQVSVSLKGGPAQALVAAARAREAALAGGKDMYKSGRNCGNS